MLTNLEVFSTQLSAPDLPLSLGGREDVDPLYIRNIDGLDPVKATINTRSFAAQNGEYYSGSSIGKRNVVITVGFNPDYVNHTVSSLRQKLYAYFMPQQLVQLRFFRDDGPTVQIFGYVESCETALFTKDPEMVISVLCPLPDFVAVSPSVVTGVADNNASKPNVAFTVVGNVNIPIKFGIKNPVGNNTTFDGPIYLFQSDGVSGGNLRKFQVTATIANGISLEVDSAQGQKSVINKYTSGDKVNLIASMTADSVWPYLVPGTNNVFVSMGSSLVRTWEMTYYERFGGL